MTQYHDYSSLNSLVIVGGAGFIGDHLLRQLSGKRNCEVKVLVHRSKPANHSNVTFFEGDLLNLNSLEGLFSKCCTVINLAFLPENNDVAVKNLASACASSQVRRLIHCSTAVVAGRADDEWVSEDTICKPYSDYQRTKLRTEKALSESAAGKFELLILRPTAVFGANGKNLLKLANGLCKGSFWTNYFKSCLFGRRSMNLVCVENVVAALVFLVDLKSVDNEIFIVADDNSISNNYRDIEDRLLGLIGKSYRIPRIPVPSAILCMLLFIAGKSSINPSVKYSDKKLADMGFRKQQSLEAGIDSFAQWFKRYSID